jgi:hypothetical protein
MPEKLGIEELKSVLILGIHLGELVDSLSNGIGIDDLGPLVRVGKSVKPAIDAIKSGKIIPEAKDLDAEEKVALKAFIVEELDLENDNLEAIIEQALSVVVDISDLSNLLKAKAPEAA